MALLEFVGGPWDGDFMGWTDPPPSEIRIPMADTTGARDYRWEG